VIASNMAWIKLMSPAIAKKLEPLFWANRNHLADDIFESFCFWNL